MAGPKVALDDASGLSKVVLTTPKVGEGLCGDPPETIAQMALFRRPIHRRSLLVVHDSPGVTERLHHGGVELGAPRGHYPTRATQEP
eukprot:CAMPEP_0182854092 /NCGR_PEP_ID=MMETSP0034_2-20130328/1053_1 /TAXON_ID=156128 /ORGANISM="Nephroselmis pyriformis, Strain CCMP717" /LENGTH=86 /DNA_ID=CAMNT_0024984889 /DNA_START=152 /DNA_END=410 /DNA_ORIENTATION=+